MDVAIVKSTNHVESAPKERHIRSNSFSLLTFFMTIMSFWFDQSFFFVIFSTEIFSATSAVRPRADVAYCIHALAKRLSRTHNWVVSHLNTHTLSLITWTLSLWTALNYFLNTQVAIKVLIVIHRTLREGDPTFRDELLNYSHRGHILRISNFKDDTSPLGRMIIMNLWYVNETLLKRHFLDRLHGVLKLGIVLHGLEHMRFS